MEEEESVYHLFITAFASSSCLTNCLLLTLHWDPWLWSLGVDLPRGIVCSCLGRMLWMWGKQWPDVCSHDIDFHICGPSLWFSCLATLLTWILSLMFLQISPTWGSGALDLLVSHSWKNALCKVGTQEIMAVDDFALSSPVSSGCMTLGDSAISGILLKSLENIKVWCKKVLLI